MRGHVHQVTRFLLASLSLVACGAIERLDSCRANGGSGRARSRRELDSRSAGTNSGNQATTALAYSVLLSATPRHEASITRHAVTALSST